jgi:hypothetical protein
MVISPMTVRMTSMVIAQLYGIYPQITQICADFFLLGAHLQIRGNLRHLRIDIFAGTSSAAE